MYDKNQHAAKLLFKKLQNYDLQAVLNDFLLYSLPISTNDTNNINTDSINIVREFLPFLMERSEATAATLLDAFGIADIRATAIKLLKYGMENGFTLIERLQTIFEFLALIDQINNEVETANIIFLHENTDPKKKLQKAA